MDPNTQFTYKIRLFVFCPIRIWIFSESNNGNGQHKHLLYGVVVSWLKVRIAKNVPDRKNNNKRKLKKFTASQNAHNR